jgi:hypothetical protein
VSLALAAHVVDETVTDFLSLWNPAVRLLEEKLPLLALPTFTFATWFWGLVVLTAILLLLSRAALRGAEWLRPLAWVYGLVMLANGLAHLAASVYLRRPAPGVVTAPLLLAASLYLIWGLAGEAAE